MARAHQLPGAPPAEQLRGNRPSLLGYRIVEAADGRSRMTWTPTPELSNPVGQVHGGYLGLIVDDVCGTAFASLLTEFLLFPTVSMQLEFHRPIQIGETVDCRGTVVRIGRRFVVVDAVVRGADGKLRARGTATFAAETEGHVMADGRPLAGFSALDEGESNDRD
jgi:acyl-CoA thioesterase